MMHLEYEHYERILKLYEIWVILLSHNFYFCLRVCIQI